MELILILIIAGVLGCMSVGTKQESTTKTNWFPVLLFIAFLIWLMTA